MLEKFIEYFRKEDLFSPNQKLLLAVSGGLDSMVLWHLMQEADLQFAVAHCNFSLRGEESDGDEAFVREAAERAGIPFFTERFDTKAHAQQNGISTQMAARDLRYHWLEEICEKKGLDFIATAHHLNDSIETIFLNLVKGTGISGLHGILPKTGNLVRPLLFATREQISHYAKEHNVAFREDSSNEQVVYERNYIRHQIIPKLKEINPNLEETFRQNINNFCAAENVYFRAINRYSMKLLEMRGHEYYVSINKLETLPAPVSILYELLKDFGFNSDQAEQIFESIDEQSGKTFESSEWRIIKDRKFLIITSKDSQQATLAIINKGDHEVAISEGKLVLELHDAAGYNIPADPLTAAIDADKLEWPLKVRRWKEGDYFYPFGMNNKKKKLSNFFVDQKLSLLDKERVWVITSGKKIVWIVGQRLDERFKITDKTERIIEVRWEK